MLSTTKLSKVFSSLVKRKLMRARSKRRPAVVIYSGYQKENGYCITLYRYPDGSSRVLVSDGGNPLAEFDIPV